MLKLDFKLCSTVVRVIGKLDDSVIIFLLGLQVNFIAVGVPDSGTDSAALGNQTMGDFFLKHDDCTT